MLAPRLTEATAKRMHANKSTSWKYFYFND